MQELTPDDFRSAGYRIFQDSLKQYAEFGLQKKITDENGIKYFITLYAYNFEKFPQVSKSWSFETDLHFDAPDGYIRMCFAVEDIAKMEERVEKLWVQQGSPYYETWHRYVRST